MSPKMKRWVKKLCVFSLFLLLLLSVPNQVPATPLYTSGTPIASFGYPILGRLASTTFQALDAAASVAGRFTVSDPLGWIVDEIAITAFGPSVFGLPANPQMVNIGITGDSGTGVPSASYLYQSLLTGIDIEQVYSVALPDLSLAPGNYWIVILPATNDPGDFTTVGWNLTSTDGTGKTAGSPDFGASWFGGEVKPLPAFEVRGDIVPEPTTLLLISLGTAGLIVKRRRVW